MRRSKNGIIYCLSEREIISLEEQQDEDEMINSQTHLSPRDYEVLHAIIFFLLPCP